MADSQQPSQPAKKAASPRQKAPSNRQVLEGAFSPAVVDAIDGRIKEVSLETLAEVKQQLVDMIEEHKKTIAAVRAMPASPERDEAVKATDETSGELKASADELNEVIEDAKAGQPVESEKADKVAKSVVKTGEAVKETSEAVSRQLAALNEGQQRHEAILAVNHDGKRPPSRLDQIEKDVADLKSWKTSANQRIEGAQSTASQAMALARASATSNNWLRRASTWALITFTVVFVLYFLIGVLTGLDWTLRDQFAWPFGLAFLAFCIGVITAKDAETTVSADANAKSNHGDEHGNTSRLSIMDHQHDEDRSSGASASADARASAR